MSVKARRQRTTKGSVPAPKKAAPPKTAAAKKNEKISTVTGTITPAAAAVSAPNAGEAKPVTAATMVQTGSAKGGSFAFGPVAKQFLADLASPETIIACDGTDVAQAIAKAVELRRNGVPFFVAPLIADSQADAALWGAMLTLEQLRDPDQIRLCFEAIALGTFLVGGKPLHEAWQVPAPIIHSLRELHQLGDAAIFRSQTERNRIEKLFQRARIDVAVCPTPRTNLPPVIADADADEIVVWAPERPFSALAMHLYALAELKKPAIFICQDSFESQKHRFAKPHEAAAVLKRAAVVVDVETADPGLSLSLAGRKISVVSPRSNGAHEALQGVYSYDPANFYSLLGAVSRARAGRRTTRRPQGNDTPILGDILRDALPAATPQTPPVSIVLATFNRRRELKRNLDAFSRQTYPNFEVVVVNDCGAPVDDIVAHYPFARLLTTPQNCGPTRALNLGLKAARGEYLGILSDDDLRYPDHITRLVAALVNSRLQVVHGDTAIRLDTKLPDGGMGTYGHLLIHDNDHDPVAAFWGGACTHGSGYLASRAAWQNINYLSEEFFNTPDHDLIMRLSARYDFGHASAVSGEMACPNDRSTLSAKTGRQLAYEINDVMRAHAPNRPLVQQRLGENIQGVDQAQQRESFYLPWTALATPLPID